MKLILMMGKSLGMRASEMLDARTGWIVERRVGFKVRAAIEIVGKAPRSGACRSTTSSARSSTTRSGPAALRASRGPIPKRRFSST